MGTVYLKLCSAPGFFVMGLAKLDTRPKYQGTEDDKYT